MIDLPDDLCHCEGPSSLAVGLDVVDRDHGEVLSDACERSSWVNQKLPIMWM